MTTTSVPSSTSAASLLPNTVRLLDSQVRREMVLFTRALLNERPSFAGLRTLKLQAALEAVSALARRAAEDVPAQEWLGDEEELEEEPWEVQEAAQQTWTEMMEVLLTRQLHMSVICTHQAQHLTWQRH